MSVKATITGYITDIFPAEIRGNFEKRVFWVKEPDSVQYPNQYSLECHQGDANLLDRFKVGQLVTVQVDIRGKKWVKDGRESCFNTLKAWKIELAAGSNTSQPAPPPPASQEGFGSNYHDLTEPLDDLPF